MTRVRVVNDPDRFPDSAGLTGVSMTPERIWENEEMVYVYLDNGLEGLWWPEDLEPVT